MSTAASPLDLARTLFRRGELDESERLFAQFLADPAMSVDAKSGLALIKLQRGDEAGALSLLQQSVNLRPTADAHYGLGVIAERNRDLDGALGHFFQARALNPKHAGATNRISKLIAPLTAEGGNSHQAKAAVPEASSKSVAATDVASETGLPDQPTFLHQLRADMANPRSPTASMSRDIISLVDSLAMSRRPRFSAYLGSIFGPIFGLVALIVLLLGFSSLGWR